MITFQIDMIFICFLTTDTPLFFLIEIKRKFYDLRKFEGVCLLFNLDNLELN